jgi:hypothetical protein
LHWIQVDLLLLLFITQTLFGHVVSDVDLEVCTIGWINAFEEAERDTRDPKLNLIKHIMIHDVLILVVTLFVSFFDGRISGLWVSVSFGEDGLKVTTI